MDKTNNCGILGLGMYVPGKVLTNSDLEKIVETSDDWITKRTGISERRILDKNIPASVMGIEAAKNALTDAGISAEDLDLIIVSTTTPDYLTPSTSCIIQKNIGAKNAAAFDLNAACTGFIYCLEVADKFIKSGLYKYVLVVSCEAFSKVVDWSDRNTCILFGDASGAAVLGPVESGYGILSNYLGADGDVDRKISLPCCFLSEDDKALRKGENKKAFRMEGDDVFVFAVRIMEHGILKILEKSNLSLDDIKLIVPHQANSRIINAVAKKLETPPNKIYQNVYKYGNTSSASIPVAFFEAYMDNKFKKGDTLILIGFGGGYTWGASMIKWSK